MPNKLINWVIFILLCLIWGSSFVLMKIGLYDTKGLPLLNPYQVAAIRILSAGLVLIPFLVAHWKKIPFKLAGYIILSGLMGSFIPAFLFCIAETKIDSTLAGTLNALTPIFVILAGLFMYGHKVASNKIWGIALGFGGSVLLFVTTKHDNLGDLAFVGFAVLATVLYGINVNMVQQKLKGVSSTIIVAFAFSALIIPCTIILWYTGFFSLPLAGTVYQKAVGASCVLGVFGTAFASVIFYVLMRRGGVVFASLVTYGIPFVALGWGWVYGEMVIMSQIICLLIILGGVYLANLDFRKIKDHAVRIVARKKSN
ncbi:MAG: DMT family transporter [Chitinophagaceae bacterium]